jgi:hypothetical protein
VINVDGLEPNNVFENKSNKKIGFVIVGVCCTLSLLISIYAISEIGRLEKSLLIKDAPVIENAIEDSSTEEVFEISKRQYDALLNNIDMLDLQHSIENGGVVTDDFVVNKIKIFNLVGLGEGTDIEELSMYIDLDSQPSMNQYYKGKGKFDLSDRELKVAVNSVLDKVKEKWEQNFKWNMDKDYNKFEEGTHYLTFKNYEIGTIEHGEFKLIGE